jgi:flagellar biosynthesis GTPase FlhF
MERLEPSQRESISKMSSDRLRMKLAKAEFDEQQVAAMSREQLLDAWAKAVAEGKDRPPSAAAAHVPAVGYDVELERRRLEFEMRKFELEEARRREEREWEEARRREELEREEARRREEREWEETRRREEAEVARLREEREEARRKEMRDLQEQELQIQRDQWEWQKSLSLRDREKQQAPAAQIKFFGSVLKNVMPRFPSDVADVPMFFEGVEKLFSSFEVPDDLKAKLLLPYLNDKAKSLLLRLEQVKQEKYSEVKAFLLNEFKLTPIQFKERFDRATRNRDETCTMFCSRLKNLLTYYCNSRQVKENFKTLFSLLIADKIKSTLPEACLDHVLTSEGDKWLECDALANVVDIYFANHTIEGRPKSVRSDFRKVGNNTVDNLTHKSNSSRPNAGGNANNRMNASTSYFRDGKGAASASGNPLSTGKGGLCYTCHSPGHKQANCPSRNAKDRAGDARVAA